MPLKIGRSSGAPSSGAVPSVTSLGVVPPPHSEENQRLAPRCDENDEILQEIDVFLSPTLIEQLHVLQYPLTQAQSPSGAATSSSSSSSFNDTLNTPADARVKPRHGKLELEIPLPANMEREGSYAFLGDQRLFRSRTIPLQTNMCIGRLVVPPSGEFATPELHLLPISGIKQMQPSFHHVDLDAQEDMNLTSEMEQLDNDGDEAMNIEKMPVLFQRKESERAIMIRKSSYAYQKSSEDSEPWIPLDVCLPQSLEYNQVMNRAVCESRGRQALAESTAQSAYIHSLQYHAEGGTIGHSPPLAPLSSIPDLKILTKRVTSLMLEGMPIPYVVLRASFDPVLVPDHQLLKALSVSAVVVRGNFVLNSQFVVPTLPAPVARCRTLVLLLLQRYGRVSRPNLYRAICDSAAHKAPLSSDRLLLLLEQVAKQSHRGWELKLPDDTSFLTQFRKQVKVFDQYWVKQEARFRLELLKYENLESG